ncbi:chromosomal replication initiator protein DnaA [Porphyromonas pogonae]|uniref:chromosomal replication initiator protein DnaA n=1 Tax=Porphyromonas pogonae TaxID=867595 RepID=UPI002E7682CC|nr:chromosomal replication initiator protein DnaA [Porphyromonas pogonae]
MSNSTDVHGLWQECLKTLRSLVESKAFETWFLPIVPISIEQQKLTLEVPSPYFGEYLETHFPREISHVLAQHIGPGASLYFDILVDSKAPKREDATMTVASSSTSKAPAPLASGNVLNDPLARKNEFNSFLNDKLSFETFYESDCNHVARAVAEAVAAKPGQSPLNPFFLYGPSGVGKTHLCQAIGLRVKAQHPEMRVLYVSSQQFEAQYVTASRFHERTDFINFYQQIDLLIIDDIQGLIGKTKTQQAFFEVFNHLYLLNKQIVLTSDKPPVDLSGMEDRLISRIKGSVTLSLARPDIDLRRKILQEKVAESGIRLGDEVMEFIASNVQNNVRELEGTLSSLLTYALITKRKIDLDFTRDIVSQSVSMEKHEITIEGIQSVISKVFHIEIDQMKDKTRRQDVVAARQAVMYLAKKHTSHSLVAIGEMLGRRNHATVLHGCNSVATRMEQDNAFRATIERVEEMLSAS